MRTRFSNTASGETVDKHTKPLFFAKCIYIPPFLGSLPTRLGINVDITAPDPDLTSEHPRHPLRSMYELSSISRCSLVTRSCGYKGQPDSFCSLGVVNSPYLCAYTVDAGTPDCVRFGCAPRLSSSPVTLHERRQQSRPSG